MGARTYSIPVTGTGDRQGWQGARYRRIRGKDYAREVLGTRRLRAQEPKSYEGNRGVLTSIYLGDRVLSSVLKTTNQKV